MPTQGIEEGRGGRSMGWCTMKRVWLRGGVFLGDLLAYRVVRDLLGRELTDAYIYGAITIVCGVIVALADL
jgi:hypothetical protein